MRSWKQTIRRTATNWLSLPPDALLDASRVTCTDGRLVVVENMEKLIHVSDTSVEIDLGDKVLALQGESFVVSLVTEQEVHVEGLVGQIVYVRKRGNAR